VENAGAGVFVEPGNSKELAANIVKLADTPSLCHQMGEAGEKIIKEKFSRKKIANDLLVLMEDLRRVND
jgi:glycosyltransferase involved in cell wall biosynthesis